MAKLTSSTRNELSDSTFALPGRKYPIPDRSHAINAKARAKQMYNAGHLGLADMRKVFRRANAKLKV